MTKAQAFRRIREVCGPEVCGSASADVASTAHNLRHLVVALLVTRDGSPCPFCAGPECNERCHLRRVLNA